MADAGAIKAGSAYIEIGGRLTALDKSIRSAEAKLRAVGGRLTGIGKKMMVVSGAMLAPLALGVREFMRAGDQLDKMSKRTGMSVKALSELGFAADRSGASMGDIEKATKKMARSIFDAEKGLSTSIDAFDALGLKIEDVKGLKPEEQFRIIGDALSKVADESTRTALAQEFFGRSGTALLPMLADGVAGLDAFAREAAELGIIISEQDATAAAELTDAAGDMWTTLRAVGVQIGAALAPALIDLARKFQKVLKAVVEWVRENQDSIVLYGKVAVAIGGIGGALLAMGTAMQVAAFAMKGLAGAMIVLRGSATTLNKALLVIGVAFAGWQLGKWISKITGLDDALVRLLGHLNIFGGKDAKRQIDLNVIETRTIREKAAAGRAAAPPKVKPIQDKAALTKDTAAEAAKKLAAAIAALPKEMVAIAGVGAAPVAGAEPVALAPATVSGGFGAQQITALAGTFGPGSVQEKIFQATQGIRNNTKKLVDGARPLVYDP